MLVEGRHPSCRLHNRSFDGLEAECQCQDAREYCRALPLGLVGRPLGGPLPRQIATAVDQQAQLGVERATTHLPAGRDVGPFKAHFAKDRIVGGRTLIVMGQACGGVPALLCSEDSSGSLKALTHQSPDLHSHAVMEIAVASLPIRGPACQKTAVMKHGRTAPGQQRYRGQQAGWPSSTFRSAYCHQRHRPAVTRHRLAMTVKGRGIRDLARVRHSSPPPGMHA
jgi:transposase-like protein